VTPEIVGVFQGKHPDGDYCIATSDEIKGSITFEENEFDGELPESGTTIVMGRLTQKRLGWRAGSARVYTIEDERRLHDKI